MGRGGLNFNVDLRENSCITSHRKRRARRRPPSAAVYNNLQPFTKVWKEEKRSWVQREGWLRDFGLKNRRLNQTRSRAKNYKTPYAAIRAVTKLTLSHLEFFFFSPMCVCVCVHQCDSGSPATTAATPLLSINVRFDLSLGWPCKSDNRRCWDKDNVSLGEWREGASSQGDRSGSVPSSSSRTCIGTWVLTGIDLLRVRTVSTPTLLSILLLLFLFHLPAPVCVYIPPWTPLSPFCLSGCSNFNWWSSQ